MKIGKVSENPVKAPQRKQVKIQRQAPVPVPAWPIKKVKKEENVPAQT